MTTDRFASLRQARLTRSAGLLPRFDRLTLALLAAWVLTMISLPIVKWTLGQAALQDGIVLAVLVQTLVVLLILQRAWGAASALRVALLVTAPAWIAEAIGSATGFPFGAYDYTPLLQPQLAGVPWLIPLAWLMMLPPAWAVAWIITGGRSRLHLAMVSALAFTAWDLFLDPQMVAWGFWEWEQPGAYFGIPLVNFLGWLFVSGLITWLVNPQRLPIAALLLVYILTWLLEAIGQAFFWGLPGPAFFGFLGMGVMLLWAYRR
jgi:putative membrane protein